MTVPMAAHKAKEVQTPNDWLVLYWTAFV